MRNFAQRLGRRIEWEMKYFLLRRPRQRTMPFNERAIIEELNHGPIPTETFEIDVEAYRQWRQKAQYERHYPDYYTDNLAEKSLEHYVAARLLDLQPGQTYLDVASQSGVAADLYRRLYGVKTLVQDLDYEPGVHGDRIGGNAANLPLADESIEAMALHCSFEHFEGDSDMRFVREMGRVLKPGGRCVIAPLYLCHYHACLTNPLLAKGVDFDPDAVIIGARTWGNRHGRFYDPAHLVERVWNQRGPLSMKVLICGNRQDADPSSYLRFIAFFEKAHAKSV